MIDSPFANFAPMKLEGEPLFKFDLQQHLSISPEERNKNLAIRSQFLKQVYAIALTSNRSLQAPCCFKEKKFTHRQIHTTTGGVLFQIRKTVKFADDVKIFVYPRADL